MIELMQVEFEFLCTDHGHVYGIGGGELHGLLFAMLEQVSPRQAAAIHASVIKPFSVSPLLGSGKRQGGFFYLEEGKHYSFTVSGLDTEMSTLLIELAKQVRPEHQFRLGTATGKWTKYNIVRQTDYFGIMAGKPAVKMSVIFRSPTSFRSQGIQKLFPQPSLVFWGLEERWNHFCPKYISLPDPDDKIMVSRYKLRTIHVKFPTYRQTGFVGEVEYRFAQTAFEANTLLRFAEFTGIGYKTSMGMGNIKIE